MLSSQQACLCCSGIMHLCWRSHHIQVRQAISSPMSKAIPIPGTAGHIMMTLLSGHGMPSVCASTRNFTGFKGVEGNQLKE